LYEVENYTYQSDLNVAVAKLRGLVRGMGIRGESDERGNQEMKQTLLIDYCNNSLPDMGCYYGSNNDGDVVVSANPGKIHQKDQTNEFLSNLNGKMMENPGEMNQEIKKILQNVSFLHNIDVLQIIRYSHLYNDDGSIIDTNEMFFNRVGLNNGDEKIENVTPNSNLGKMTKKIDKNENNKNENKKNNDKRIENVKNDVKKTKQTTSSSLSLLLEGQTPDNSDHSMSDNDQDGANNHNNNTQENGINKEKNQEKNRQNKNLNSAVKNNENNAVNDLVRRSSTESQEIIVQTHGSVGNIPIGTHGSVKNAKENSQNSQNDEQIIEKPKKLTKKELKKIQHQQEKEQREREKAEHDRLKAEAKKERQLAQQRALVVQNLNLEKEKNDEKNNLLNNFTNIENNHDNNNSTIQRHQKGLLSGLPINPNQHIINNNPNSDTKNDKNHNNNNNNNKNNEKNKNDAKYDPKNNRKNSVPTLDNHTTLLHTDYLAEHPNTISNQSNLTGFSDSINVSFQNYRIFWNKFWYRFCRDAQFRLLILFFTIFTTFLIISTVSVPLMGPTLVSPSHPLALPVNLTWRQFYIFGTSFHILTKSAFSELALSFSTGKAIFFETFLNPIYDIFYAFCSSFLVNFAIGYRGIIGNQFNLADNVKGIHSWSIFIDQNFDHNFYFFDHKIINLGNNNNNDAVVDIPSNRHNDDIFLQ